MILREELRTGISYGDFVRLSGSGKARSDENLLDSIAQHRPGFSTAGAVADTATHNVTSARHGTARLGGDNCRTNMESSVNSPEVSELLGGNRDQRTPASWV